MKFSKMLIIPMALLTGKALALTITCQFTRPDTGKLVQLIKQGFVRRPERVAQLKGDHLDWASARSFFNPSTGRSERDYYTLKHDFDGVDGTLSLYWKNSTGERVLLKSLKHVSMNRLNEDNHFHFGRTLGATFGPVFGNPGLLGEQRFRPIEGFGKWQGSLDAVKDWQIECDVDDPHTLTLLQVVNNEAVERAQVTYEKSFDKIERHNFWPQAISVDVSKVDDSKVVGNKTDMFWKSDNDHWVDRTTNWRVTTAMGGKPGNKKRYFRLHSWDVAKNGWGDLPLSSFPVARLGMMILNNGKLTNKLRFKKLKPREKAGKSTGAGRAAGAAAAGISQARRRMLRLARCERLGRAGKQ